MTTRPYRPSNGTEGDGFRARFCDRCIRDLGEACGILDRATLYRVTEPGYPSEWVYDEGDAYRESARCTAFVDREEHMAQKRIERHRRRASGDLFGEGA